MDLHLARALPAIGLDFPETIFLNTVKGTLKLLIDLSAFDTILLLTILFLLYTSPNTRPVANIIFGFFSLVIGIEIAFINIYVLLCSYFSPSTTLSPLTLVIIGIMNAVTPILTDTVLLLHMVTSALTHQPFSHTKLIVTMAFPTLLKFGRLVNAAIYVADCGRYVLTSVTSPDGVPDESVLDAAQALAMQIACALQMVDNGYSSFVFWISVVGEKLSTRLHPAHKSALATQSMSGIVWTAASNFGVPLVLGGIQLAASIIVPDDNLAFYLEQFKVIINVAGAGSATVVAALVEQHRPKVHFELGQGEATPLEPSTVRSYSSTKSSKRGGDEEHPKFFHVGTVEANASSDHSHLSATLPTL